MQKNPPVICRFYAALIREHERIILERTQITRTIDELRSAIESRQKILQRLQNQADFLLSSKVRVETEIFVNLDEAKEAIRIADVRARYQRQEDE